MYALNIDKETGRILSVTYAKYASKNNVLVDEFPPDNITDYCYKNGVYVYEPLPHIEEQSQPTTEERLKTLEEAFIALLEGKTE